MVRSENLSSNFFILKNIIFMEILSSKMIDINIIRQTVALVPGDGLKNSPQKLSFRLFHVIPAIVQSALKYVIRLPKPST